MEDDAVGYAGSKWDGAVDALSDVVTSLDNEVEFGLMLYPDGNADSNQCRAGDLEVGVGVNRADDIVTSLNFSFPGGGTPTAATLQQARQELDGLGDTGGARVVVLATDGGPNCNAGLNANSCRCVNPDGCADARNCLDDVASTNAAASLTAAGYSVFVVGIPGSENFSDVLNGLATAGGTALPGATGYYQADDSVELSTSLEQIASRVATCRFDLDQQVDNATSLAVSAGTNTVQQDPTRANGWDLVDADTIELFGAACDQLQTQPVNVTVDYAARRARVG
jgi:hypothetical protein